MTASALVFATARSQIAQYVQDVIWVYSVLIFAYVIMSMALSLGLRIPYSRWSNAVLGFLRDVSEPYLRIFRRFLPMAGGIDFSPLIGLLVLNFVGNLVVRLIQG
jgi:uncharacterized protein YggT (Ycf19 family)